MKNLNKFILIGQYGGQKWVVGDYETENEALEIMDARIKQDEIRKGRPGPPLRITLCQFYNVYEAKR